MTLAWSVCESLLSVEWKTLLNNLKDSGRMTKTRMNTLSGTDFTASIITEILEMMDSIDYDLYRRLGSVVKSRGKMVN